MNIWLAAGLIVLGWILLIGLIIVFFCGAFPEDK